MKTFIMKLVMVPVFLMLSFVGGETEVTSIGNLTIKKTISNCTLSAKDNSSVTFTKGAGESRIQYSYQLLSDTSEDGILEVVSDGISAAYNSLEHTGSNPKALEGSVDGVDYTYVFSTKNGVQHNKCIAYKQVADDTYVVAYVDIICGNKALKDLITEIMSEEYLEYSFDA